MKNRITNPIISTEEQNGSLFNFFTIFCVLFFLLIAGIHILDTQAEVKKLKKDFKVMKEQQDSINSIQNNALGTLLKEKSR